MQHQHFSDRASRRAFLSTAASVMTAALAVPAAARLQDGGAGNDAIDHPISPSLMAGSETIAILLYPGFTALDAVGPQYALASMMGSQVQFVAESLDPVPCDTGFAVTPNATFDECPTDLDLFVVPGGMTGTLKTIEDTATMDFVRDHGGRAKVCGSVCTGSLILAAAGLLDGYRATSHWQTLELLKLGGATPVTDRVVFDRNRVTGGGVTAGLDFGLELVRHYRDDTYAEGVQLLAQYDPQPPFPRGGNPATATPAVVKLLDDMHAPFIDKARQTIEENL